MTRMATPKNPVLHKQSETNFESQMLFSILKTENLAKNHRKLQFLACYFLTYNFLTCYFNKHSY